MSDPVQPSTVRVVDDQGNAYDVPADQANDAIAHLGNGAHVQSDEESLSQANKEVWSKETSGARAIFGSAFSGATFGLSDLALDPIQASRDREVHPILSTLGSLGGALLTGGATAGALGGAVVEGLGGGTFARLAGGAVEGGLYGAGNAVSDLALSDDPITAERIVGSLSSNILLGGGIGVGAAGLSRLAELGLEKAGNAVRAIGEAKSAVAGLPEDLAGMDETGLKGALKSATADHAADIKAETDSLEQLRVEKRTEMANQVKDLHDDLSTERPIFSALSNGDKLNPALADIEGVSDARVQLAKSYESIRRSFNNPLAVQRDPMRLIDALEQRQGGLETLRDKMPELQGALANDSRGAMLQHVDDALAETKQQISDIRSLAKSNPVTSERLATLQAGPSARMDVIKAAQDALKNGRELGIVGKAAKGAAFGGVTALAHAIPGVGFAAPFLGKYAADAVGLVAKRLSRVAAGASEKTAGFVDRLLSSKMGAPSGIPTARAVLRSARYGVEAAGSKGDLASLVKQRADELKQQTMYGPTGAVQVRPEVRQQIASTFDGVRQFSPPLADKLETAAVRKIEVQAQAIPRKPDSQTPQVGPDKWNPTSPAARSFALTVRACEDPHSVEERLAHGIMTPQEASAYQQVCPARFDELKQNILDRLPLLQKTLPMQKKIALSIFTGIPITPVLQPNVLSVVQATFAVEPNSGGGTQSPRATPQFGTRGTPKDVDKPTPSQERQL